MFGGLPPVQTNDDPLFQVDRANDRMDADHAVGPNSTVAVRGSSIRQESPSAAAGGIPVEGGQSRRRLLAHFGSHLRFGHPGASLATFSDSPQAASVPATGGRRPPVQDRQAEQYSSRPFPTSASSGRQATSSPRQCRCNAWWRKQECGPDWFAGGVNHQTDNRPANLWRTITFSTSRSFAGTDLAEQH